MDDNHGFFSVVSFFSLLFSILNTIFNYSATACALVTFLYIGTSDALHIHLFFRSVCRHCDCCCCCYRCLLLQFNFILSLFVITFLSVLLRVLLFFLRLYSVQRSTCHLNSELSMYYAAGCCCCYVFDCLYFFRFDSERGS